MYKQVNKEIEVKANKIYHKNQQIWYSYDNFRSKHLGKIKKKDHVCQCWSEILPLHLGLRHDLAEFKYSINDFGVIVSS